METETDIRIKVVDGRKSLYLFDLRLLYAQNQLCPAI